MHFRDGKKLFSPVAGNIMLALFAAIGAVGLVGATGMTVLKGPVRSMHNVTQKTIAENNIIASSKLAVMAAANQANGGDCDGDNTVEPVAWSVTGTGPKPTGGGYLPANIGASLQDPWGNTYGYCVWDHGAAIQTTCPTPTQRLRGTGVGGSGPVIAIISSGADRTFQTSCADAPANVTKVSGSDDIVLSYTYAEAMAASGGLWNLQSADLNTAEIQKNLEVKDSGGDTTFELDRETGIGDFVGLRTGSIAAKGVLPVIMAGGLKMDNETNVTQCTLPQHAGTVRYHSTEGLQVCDGTTWVSAGSGEGGAAGGSIAQVVRTQVPSMPQAPDGKEWADAVVCRGSDSNKAGVYTLKWFDASTNQVRYIYEYAASEYFIDYHAITGARTANYGSGGLPADTCPTTYAAVNKVYFGNGGSGSSGPLLPSKNQPDVIGCLNTSSANYIYYYKAYDEPSTTQVRYDNANNGYVYYNTATGAKGASTSGATSVCPSNISAVPVRYNFGGGEGGGGGGSSIMVQAYQTGALTATASPTAVPYNSEIIDTANAFNPATGVFTVPEAGIYMIDAAWYSTSIAPGICSYIHIYKNGSYIKSNLICNPGSTSLSYSNSIAGTVSLAQNDIIQIYASASSGSIPLTSLGPPWQYLSITKVGGSGSSGGGSSLWTQAGSNIHYNTGNVGIGTGTPQTPLHIMSPSAQAIVAQLQRTSYATVSQLRLTDGGLNFFMSADTGATYSTDPSLFLKGDGNVGVGTSAPAVKFHTVLATAANIAGSGIEGSYPITRFIAQSNGISRGLEIGAPTEGIASPVYLKVSGTSGRFSILNQYNTESMNILDNGNIGIGGVAAPSGHLHILGKDSALPIVIDRPFTGASIIMRNIAGPNSTNTYPNVTDRWEIYPEGVSTGGTASRLRFLTRNGGTSATHLAIDNSGNVGIGTTDPKARLHVHGTGVGTAPASSGTVDSTMNLRVSRGTVGVDTGMLDNGTGYIQVRNVANFADLYPLMLQPVGGNVGIGTTAPTAKLDVNGTVIVRGGLGVANGRGGIGYYNVSPYDQVELGVSNAFPSTSLSFFTNSVSRMNINPAGNVGIGTVSPLELFHVAGTARVDGHLKGGSGSNFHIDTTTPSMGVYLNYYSTGNVFARNTLLASSDIRLKKDIKPIEGSLDKLDAMNGVYFHWKDPQRTGQQVGLIAQDVEKVFPDLVHEDEKGFKTVSYSALVAPIINAIKELKAIIDDIVSKFDNQQKEIDNLKQENQLLRERLDALESQAKSESP